MKESIKTLLNYFLIGILAVIPVVIILQILIFVKDFLSSFIHLVYGFSDNYSYTIIIFCLSFVLFTWIGSRIAQQGRSWVIAKIDNIIEKIPLLNTIYRIIKKVIEMFFSHDSQKAKEVVYIEYPKEGLWVPAYVTNKKEAMYVLFVPTSPNPTSGFTLIVHESKIVKSDMSVEDATSFIVSVGVDFVNEQEISKLS